MKNPDSHLIYFKAEKDLITLFCPDGHRSENTKTITLSGAGVLTIPSGCRITYDGDKKSVSLGYINEQAEVTLNLDEAVWRIDLTEILPLLDVKEKVENSTLWVEDEKDEKFIEEGIRDTWEILDYIEFTPSGVTYTLCSIILYTFITTILLVVLFVLVCRPNCCRTCSKQCCGVGNEKYEMRAPGRNVVEKE